MNYRGPTPIPSPFLMGPGHNMQFDPSALLPIDNGTTASAAEDPLSQAASFAVEGSARTTARVGVDSVPLIGSLEIESDGPGLVGDVLFGDPEKVKFGAALPLQVRPFQEAVFGHVANLGQFFTGVALFNPNAEAAEVALEVYTKDGESVGTKALSLQPGDRLSKTLKELVPSSAEQAGGYIKVTSDRPIIGQELFGTMDLRLQSAVPPTVRE